jgi:hypothetical protein
MVDVFQGRDIIVRSIDPSEMLQRLAQADMERIAYLQILGTGGAIDSLIRWEHSVPVDLVIQHPESDLPLLYRYAPLITRRPVRITVPVAAGFSKVVKLALSLNFAVKLDVSQPEPALIEELLKVVTLYLHQSTVSQPVEFIHGMFWSFYGKNPATLWSIQEEDPAYVRYITDSGQASLPPRLSGAALKYGLTSFIQEFTEALIVEKQECGECAFFDTCAGYFKWPLKDYRCDGVKALFQTLRAAAGDLSADIAAFGAPGQENRK